MVRVILLSLLPEGVVKTVDEVHVILPQLPHSEGTASSLSPRRLSLERLPRGVRETAVVYGSPQGVYDFQQVTCAYNG